MKFNKFLKKALSSLTIISSLNGAVHAKDVNRSSDSIQNVHNDGSKMANNFNKQLSDFEVEENKRIFNILKRQMWRVDHIIQHSSVSYLDGGQTVELRWAINGPSFEFNLKSLKKMSPDDRKKEVYSEICQRIIEPRIKFIMFKIQSLSESDDLKLFPDLREHMLHREEIRYNRYKKLDLKYIKSNMDNAVKELLLQSENRPNEELRFKYKLPF